MKWRRFDGNGFLRGDDLDGVTQIADYVAANPGFDTVHLISHGSPGQVAVGTLTLSEATIGGYIAQPNQIGARLNAGGDLLIYGCDVAQGVGGQQLITDLSRLTRLDVAASTNRTGSSGDWVLEAATGSIENALPQLQYLMELTDYRGFDGVDVARYRQAFEDRSVNDRSTRSPSFPQSPNVVEAKLALQAA